MMRQFRAGYAPLVLIGVAAAALAVTGINIARSQNPPPPSDHQTDQAVLRVGPQEIARLTDRRVQNLDDPRWHQALGIRTLTRNSSIIIIGTPQRNACKLSADGQSVTTDYQVLVTEVVRGNLRAGNTVAVSLPGGVARLGDGTFIETRTPGYRKMINDKSYLIFLSEDETRSDLLVPSAGPQGIYELPPGDVPVKHYGRSFNLPPDDSAAPSVALFLKEVRKAAR